MTHQPPIPDAATSPYPLHPEPIPEEQKQATAEVAARADVAPASGLLESRVSGTALGVGAALGIGAAAAVTGLLYARKRAGATQPKKTGGDDKRKRGPADRRRVAAGEGYEVGYFARKHKISAAAARSILEKSGPDRAAANALAERRKKG